MDWHADVPPTYEAIAGASCLDQGSAHIKAITETGGSILGHRPLELDNIEPWEFRGAEFDKNSIIYRGLHPVRIQQPADRYLPVLRTWGCMFAVEIAEQWFIKAKK